MHRIGFVLFPGANILSTAPVSTFEVANFCAGKPFYELQILSENGGPVRTSWGITIDTEAFGDPDFDTLLIGAGTEIEEATPKLLEFIARGATVSRRVGSPLHWCVHPCAGRDSRRSARDDSLGIRTRAASSVSAGEGRSRSHLPDRRAGVDVGGDDGGHRSRAGDDREGPGRRNCTRGGEEDGGLSPARRWPVTILDAAGVGAEIGSHPERLELCPPQSENGAFRGATRRGSESEPTPVQPRLPRRDRAVAREGGREPPRRSGTAPDGTRATAHRRRGAAKQGSPTANECDGRSYARSDNRHKLSGVRGKPRLNRSATPRAPGRSSAKTRRTRSPTPTARPASQRPLRPGLARPALHTRRAAQKTAMSQRNL